MAVYGSASLIAVEVIALPVVIALPNFLETALLPVYMYNLTTKFGDFYVIFSHSLSIFNINIPNNYNIYIYALFVL